MTFDRFAMAAGFGNAGMRANRTSTSKSDFGQGF